VNATKRTEAPHPDIFLFPDKRNTERHLITPVHRASQCDKSAVHRSACRHVSRRGAPSPSPDRIWTRVQEGRNLCPLPPPPFLYVASTDMHARFYSKGLIIPSMCSTLTLLSSCEGPGDGFERGYPAVVFLSRVCAYYAYRTRAIFFARATWAAAWDRHRETEELV
jgi:hypothetical protein